MQIFFLQKLTSLRMNTNQKLDLNIGWPENKIKQDWAKLCVQLYKRNFLNQFENKHRQYSTSSSFLTKQKKKKHILRHTTLSQHALKQISRQYEKDFQTDTLLIPKR